MVNDWDVPWVSMGFYGSEFSMVNCGIVRPAARPGCAGELVITRITGVTLGMLGWLTG